MTTATAERTLTAFLDGEDSPDISNPIHSTEVAAQYGYRGALVGGVTVYGWLTPVILETLGERWLSDGWADVRFRRPVFPGDALTARAELRTGELAAVAMINQEGAAAIEGEAGVGHAPWLASLHLPVRRTAEPVPGGLPPLTLENAPVGQDLRPMPVPWSLEETRAWAAEKQRDTSARWTSDEALVHPSWLAARMTPLIHHSYHYGPAIHTRSQVQHLAPARAGQLFTVAGHFLEAYEQNGHHVAVVDGVILDAQSTEVARIRHTTIFRTRPPK
ncbi:MAG TPA: MaoC/PaaZ C-terminal domain-containing protein [Tepidiformaceae bacterium]|nr:MaoC/PaaZ C-terminal domain-containing protein [Tepidiformaceae bacterium]